MRFPSLLLFLGVIAASFGASQAAPTRKIVPQVVSLRSPAGHFTIWLPNQAFPAGRRMRNLPQGAVAFLSNTATINYAVIATPQARMPVPGPRSQGTFNPKTRLDATQAAYLKSSGTILQKQQEIRLGGNAGRELTLLSFDSTSTFRTRFYATPAFDYQILAAGSVKDAQKQAAQINRVFDSFRILPQYKAAFHWGEGTNSKGETGGWGPVAQATVAV